MATKRGECRQPLFSVGHRPSAAGQTKHFFINESFHEALQVHGANPTPLRGTQLVVGRFGIFNIARLNVPSHQWVNLHRSATRKKLAELNAHIDRKYVQGDLFSDPQNVAAGTIFIVGVMDGIDENGIAQLGQVVIALPAPNMKSWLYFSRVSDFLRLYDQSNNAEQLDNAIPTLKTQRKKQSGDDQRN